MKLRVLKVATVTEFVQFGFQPISHFLLFFPGKERIISGAKLHNVRAVGFDLLPLPGTIEVSYGKKYIYNLLPPMDNFPSSHCKISSGDTKNQSLSVRSPLVFKSVELDTIATWEGGVHGS